MEPIQEPHLRADDTAFASVQERKDELLGPSGHSDSSADMAGSRRWTGRHDSGSLADMSEDDHGPSGISTGAVSYRSAASTRSTRSARLSRSSTYGDLLRAATAETAEKELAFGRLLRSYIPDVVFLQLVEEGRFVEQEQLEARMQSGLGEAPPTAPALLAPLVLPMRREVAGAVLFCDISGFTPLTQRLAAMAEEGAAEVLTGILNSYFDPILDHVREYKGDVVQFAGDGLLLIFPVDFHGGTLLAAAASAVRCGMDIQNTVKRLADAEDILPPSCSGITIGIKIGCGIGRAYLQQAGVELQTLSTSLVNVRDGEMKRHTILLVGDPVDQAVQAEANCKGGEVTLSPRAAQLLGNVVNTQSVKGGAAFIIKSLKTGKNMKPPGVLALPEVTVGCARVLAPYVDVSVSSKLIAGQSAWIGELRRLAVVFVAVQGSFDTDDAEGITNQLQEIYEVLSMAVHRYEGSVNKFFKDDKGYILMAIFGLPPWSTEKICDRAVMAASQMEDDLLSVNRQGRIGVAFGDVYSGVVGAHHRREHTVMGDSVNLSARLMQNATKGVLVSESVMANTSSQEGNGAITFKTLAPIQVKGMTDPVPVFLPTVNIVENQVRQFAFATRLIGRKNELATAVAQVLRLDHCLIVADQGLGKSRLVHELVQVLPEKHGLDARARVSYGLTYEKSTAYFPYRSLFASILTPPGLKNMSKEEAAATHRAHIRHVLSHDIGLIEFLDKIAMVLHLALPSFAEGDLGPRSHGGESGILTAKAHSLVAKKKPKRFDVSLLKQRVQNGSTASLIPAISEEVGGQPEGDHHHHHHHHHHAPHKATGSTVPTATGVATTHATVPATVSSANLKEAAILDNAADGKLNLDSFLTASVTESFNKVPAAPAETEQESNKPKQQQQQQQPGLNVPALDTNGLVGAESGSDTGGDGNILVARRPRRASFAVKDEEIQLPGESELLKESEKKKEDEAAAKVMYGSSGGFHMREHPKPSSIGSDKSLSRGDAAAAHLRRLQKRSGLGTDVRTARSGGSWRSKGSKTSKKSSLGRHSKDGNNSSHLKDGSGANDTDGGYNAAGGSGDNNAVRDLLIRFLSAFALRERLFIILEDIQWMDRMSLELAIVAMEQCNNVNVVMTARTEFQNREEYKLMKAMVRVAMVDLPSLTLEEGIELVSEAWEVSGVPEELGQRLHEKALGSPLFLHELAQSVYADGFVDIVTTENGVEAQLAPHVTSVDMIELPDTVSDLIRGRIDKMTTRQQLLLKVMSVVGEFLHLDALTAVFPIESERHLIPAILHQFNGMDIVTSGVKRGEYVVKQDAFLEAAYSLMLLSQRRMLHSSMARYLEKTFKRNLGTYYPLLVHHFHLAGDVTKCTEYLVLAGVQALEARAYDSGVEFLSAALSINSKLIMHQMQSRATQVVLDAVLSMRELSSDTPWEVLEESDLATPLDLIQVRKMRSYLHRKLAEVFLAVGLLQTASFHLEQALSLYDVWLPDTPGKLVFWVGYYGIKQLVTLYKSAEVAAKTGVSVLTPRYKDNKYVEDGGGGAWNKRNRNHHHVGDNVDDILHMARNYDVNGHHHHHHHGDGGGDGGENGWHGVTMADEGGMPVLLHDEDSVDSDGEETATVWGTRLTKKLLAKARDFVRMAADVGGTGSILVADTEEGLKARRQAVLGHLTADSLDIPKNLHIAKVYAHYFEYCFHTGQTMMALYCALEQCKYVTMMGSVGEAELALGNANLTLILAREEHHKWARLHSSQALIVSRQASDDSTLSTVLLITSLYALSTGKWEEATVGFEEVINRAISENDMVRQEEGKLSLAHSACLQGNFTLAHILYEEVVASGVTRSDGAIEGLGLLGQAWSQCMSGRFTEALASLDERSMVLDLDGLDDLEVSITNFNALALRTLVQIRSHDTPAALDIGREMLVDTVWAMMDDINFRTLGAFLGLSCVAEATADYATELGLRIKRDSRGGTEFQLHTIQIFEKKLDDIIALMARYAGQYPIIMPRLHLIRGRTAWIRGDAKNTIKHLSASLMAGKELDMAYEQALAQYYLGKFNGTPDYLTNLVCAKRIFDSLNETFFASRTKKYLHAISETGAVKAGQLSQKIAAHMKRKKSIMILEADKPRRGSRSTTTTASSAASKQQPTRTSAKKGRRTNKVAPVVPGLAKPVRS